MIDKKEYLKQYRKKNRDKLNAYQREYLQDDEHREKHRVTCDKYRKNNMTAETRAKIKAYQREYYLKRKAKRNSL